MTGTWIAVALSLSLGDHGNNGLNEHQLRMLVKEMRDVGHVCQGAAPQCVGQAFEKWLGAGEVSDPAARAEETKDRAAAMYYFVRCALPDRVSVTYEIAPNVSIAWPGHFGLLGGGIAPGTTVDVGKLGELKPFAPDDLHGRWVSACMMAHVNVYDSHEFISLRGNPEDPKAREVLCPSDPERWVMGQPEGVFAADLYSGHAPAPAPACTLEGGRTDLRSYTASLNLGELPPPPLWTPPNAIVGRRLDFDDETRDACGRLALLLGRANDHRPSFEPSLHVTSGASPAPASTACTSDPDYAANRVCIDEPSRNDDPHFVDCATPGAAKWPPLFVHMPRLANFEAATTGDAFPERPFRVVAKPALAADQVVACKSSGRGSCIGPHPYLTAGQHPAPYDPWSRGPGKKVVNLRKGQSLEVTLTFDPQREVRGVKLTDKEPYAAIIRYRCPDHAGCAAQVTAPRGTGVRAFNAPTQLWRSTDGEFRWLVAYPVNPVKGALSVTVTGVDSKLSPPDLDAVGFLPAPIEALCQGTFYSLPPKGIEVVWNPGKERDQTLFGFCKPWIETTPLAAAAVRGEPTGQKAR